MVFTLLGNFAPDILLAEIFFSISIVLMSIAVIIVFIYLRHLRLEKIGIQTILFLLFLLVIKTSALISNPVNIHKINGVFLREVHLWPSFFVTLFLVILITVEFGLYIRDCLLLPTKKPNVKKLVPTYAIIVSALILFILAPESTILRVFLPYLEAILFGSGLTLLYVMFGRKSITLILLPIEIHGFLLHTYGGVPILREALLPKFEKTVALTSSLVASLIGLEMAIEGGELRNVFRTHRFSRTSIIMYFGRMVIGTIIANKDSAVLFNITKAIVNEFEEKIKYIDEGMILDSDVEKAQEILRKYLEILL